MDIQWLRLSSRHDKITQSLPCAYTGRSTYYKMFLPELLADYPRLIYLDSDVIVQADISDLWMADFEGNYVLAVQDLINPFVSSPWDSGIGGNWEGMQKASISMPECWFSILPDGTKRTLPKG